MIVKQSFVYEEEYKDCKDKLIRIESEYEEIDKQIDQCAVDIEKRRKLAKDTFSDVAFWTRQDQPLFCDTPWMSTELLDKRAELLTLAFDVHKAFINAAAAPIRDNLQLFANLLSGKPQKSDLHYLLLDLWATQFLFTPVISSTFASVHRLFKHIPPATFGWLLIDEAGRATPQAAVGALMRYKQAVIVGDSLQIEPICSLPDKLIDGICQECQVNSDNWIAPKASVQTRADQVTRYGCTIASDQPDRISGSPLLVHRRCENPMFDISNRVACNDLMIYATAAKETSSKITMTLGDSQWFDISGKNDDK